MIVETQVQESTIAASIEKQQMIAVLDLDLMFVAGGGGSGILF